MRLDRRYGETKIVISTVGAMKDPLNGDKFCEIGANRYYETMCFHADKVDNKYWDADVSRQVYVDSKWAIGDLYADNEADDMHEKIVAEITNKLINKDLL